MGIKRYWEKIGRTKALANSKDPTKRKAERHRLYMATGRERYLKKGDLTVKEVRRAYTIAKQGIHRVAVEMKAKEPHLHLKNLEASLEQVFFEEDFYPTHFRSDIEPEDLP